jgi:predicted XRE-type DNA-binding protein
MKRVNTMPPKASTPVTAFASVWDAIEATPLEAANMRAKSTLLMALQHWLEQTTGTQKAAAAHLGITQPRLSDLKRGRIDLFSLDTLLNMAEQAGLAPTIKLRAPSRAKPVTELPKERPAPRRKLVAA